MNGYTRVSALGPIAEFVEDRGGSIGGVFDRVDLPLAILDTPDLPLPLTEQFKVLSAAGREIGDPFIGASLGRHVNMSELSAFGAWVADAPSLAGAIDRSKRGLNRFLQTATVLRLQVTDNRASWSIEFLDPGRDGRFQNELLGVSYLIDGIRSFAGRGWFPRLVRSTCVGPAEAAVLETIFEAPVQYGAPVCAVEFDVSLLAATRSSRRANPSFAAEPPIPAVNSGRESVEALAVIALLDGHPRIDWIATKLGMSRRSLQRSLEIDGCSFSEVLEDLRIGRAKALLEGTRKSLTEIAFQLGYSDSAHFSRAFRRWTGMAPSRYRRTWRDRSFTPSMLSGTRP